MKNENERYDSVQLMRGIAAVSVIFSHILMFEVGGFGVDLFFCISGFIMMHVTQKNDNKFLLKRAVRIIPLYWIATFSMMALLMIMPSVFQTSILLYENLIKSLLFIPAYMGSATDQSFALLRIGWTLVMEVFFYLVFFICMKINHKLRHVITTIAFIIMVISGLLISTDNIYVAFYFSPIILEFSLGMFAYKIFTKRSKDGRSMFPIVFSAFIWTGLFIAKPVAFFTNPDRFLLYGLPSFLFFILIFKFFEHKKVPHFCVMLGNISYSLYLTHFFIVNGFSRLIYNLDEFTIIGALLSIFIVIPLCIGLAWVSWYLFEKRFTNWVRKKLKI